MSGLQLHLVGILLAVSFGFRGVSVDAAGPWSAMRNRG